MRASDLYRGGDHIDGGDRQHGHQHGRDDDQAPLRKQGLTQRMQIQIARFRRDDRLWLNYGLRLGRLWGGRL